MKRNWPYSPLGELVKMRSGGTPSRENLAYWNGTIPWFSGKDLKSFYLRDSIEHIAENAVGKGTRTVGAGALLVLVRGMTLMKEVPVGVTLRDASFNQDVKALLPDPKKMEVRFLGYFLRCENHRLRNCVTTAGHGTGRLPLESLAEYPIPTPPLPEQQKIADILGTWDEALEKLDALIAAQDRRKQALMQQLLTGQRRLPGFSKPWTHAKLGDLFENRTEPNRLDLTLLSITADRGVIRRDTLVKRDTSSEDKSKYLRIAPGDIGYNTMRMWQGVSALSSLEGIVSPAYTICVPTNRIDGKFAAHFFKLPHTISLFHRHSQGLVDDTLNLKFHHFATIEVTIPADTAEQRKIASILHTTDSELRILHQQRTALDQQKRGLMQHLLTGRIRVKTTSS